VASGPRIVHLMRLSTVILPIYRWADEGREVWQRAEALGFHAAYTYDHLSWRVPFRDRTWFGAIPPSPPPRPRPNGSVSCCCEESCLIQSGPCGGGILRREKPPLPRAPRG
jgi:hypothetical protein